MLLGNYKAAFEMSVMNMVTVGIVVMPNAAALARVISLCIWASNAMVNIWSKP
jgi:hypothetical protein